MKCLLVLLPFIILSSGTRVRLRGTDSTSYQGRVEIYYNGTWGTVCDDFFDNDDAEVICRMLGFRKGGKAFKNARFGKGSGQIWLDNVNCSLHSIPRDISECTHDGWGIHNCNHGEDAGVSCNFLDIRLTNGTSDNNGRVEVYYGESWGTICDDGWNTDASRVVCRQLGYRNQLYYNGSGTYGNGKGRILMDDVNCSLGYIPEKIWNCSFIGWGVGNCRHSEDIGVKCVENTVKLIGGRTFNRGRVEILQNGEWGTICDNGFGVEEARIICNMLGYKNGHPYSFFDPSNGSIYVDNLECPSRHYRSRQPLKLGDMMCAFDGWGLHSCSHQEDVGVWCGSRRKEIGIVEGKANSGRIKVYDGNAFGTLCKASQDPSTADTLCRFLGYVYGGVLISNPDPTSSSMSVVMDLSCEGHETYISRCNGTWVSQRCPEGQDTWINCINSCEDGRYGHQCSELCHCALPGCDIGSGNCRNEGCLPGWQGLSCSDECRNGTFGKDCFEICHCSVPGCHHVTGVCNHQDAGCQDGWTGTSCDNCKADDLMYIVIIVCMGVLLVVSIATNIGFCIARRRKKEKTCDRNLSDQNTHTAVTVTSDPVYEDLDMQMQQSICNLYDGVNDCRMYDNADCN